MDNAPVEARTSVIDTLNLQWLARLFSSTIGRKFVMGITGLLLCGFLVAHLAGNLLLYSGREAFDRYAHKLHEMEILPLLELGLLILFLLHVYLAIVTTLENRRARSLTYAVKQSKRPPGLLKSPPENWMFVSGTIVLGFVLLHLADLRLGLRFDVDCEAQPFVGTVKALSDPVSRLVYIAGTIVLGFHLSHGFASAFQSLGLSHPKYTPVIKAFGLVFAVVIAGGFCSLPILIPSLPRIASQAEIKAIPSLSPVPVEQVR